MSRKEGSYDALRVLEALGRIGYDPVDALMDIADNSVSADASRILISIGLENLQPEEAGTPKAAISKFVVADDGCGMDEEKLDNALALGSSTAYYDEDTLSKFGMGLKSAASSLGGRLEILTKSESGEDNLKKAILDRSFIKESNGKYVYELEKPSEDEEDVFYDLCGSSGTIVLIRDVHRESLPSPTEIEDDLKERIGVVYHYYLTGNVPDRSPIDIFIDEEKIDPVDPLFENEATGNLDENNWDGTSVKWITRPQPIQLDPQAQCEADLRITQLPHPPSVKSETGTAKAQVRRDYMIGSGHYGFYIYRNYRLISWADSLDFVSQRLHYYGFRGKLMINDDADDLLNIDVTKSRIQLSEIASDQLAPEVNDALKKSRDAWRHRTEELKKDVGEDPHDDINEEIDKAADVAEKNDEKDEEVASKSQKDRLKDRRKRATKSKPADDDEKEKVRSKGERVQYVDHLDNDQLWERAHDPTHGLIVRVNRRHKFFREILVNYQDNHTLIKVLDFFFFSLARGDYDFVYKSSKDYDDAESSMQEYRERVGAQMSELIRLIDPSSFDPDDSP